MISCGLKHFEMVLKIGDRQTTTEGKMDRSNDTGLPKKEPKTAADIIAFLEPEPELSNKEWLEYKKVVDRWIKDPEIPDSEKWIFRLSGFGEMLSMICE